MLRIVASFFASNTKQTSNAHEETAIHVVSNPAVRSEDSLIQSLRQKKQQELIQKILLRKISHQAFMSHYAQDHLPLSQIQEKLEEDNLPLTVLQEKLKQRDDDIYINTTTKENINFLLYNKSPSRSRLLTKPRKTKPRKYKPTQPTPPTLDTSATNDKDPTPKDDRDYDVWDDAMIGHLMNLVDTIGMEAIQEEIAKEIPKVENELVRDVIRDVIRDKK